MTPIDLPQLGALLADRNRSTMLLELLDRRALPASELAARARISRPLASMHLARLETAGLVTVEKSGRHRYYRLAGPELAAALEGLSSIAPPAGPSGGLREHARHAALRHARSCYDHLAGALAVDLAERLVADRLLQPAEADFAVTDAGVARLREIGIDVEALSRGRRALSRGCLDWTERRPHLAGALGASLLDHFLARRWLRRHDASRALILTPKGVAGLRDEWRLDPSPAPAR